MVGDDGLQPLPQVQGHCRHHQTLGGGLVSSVSSVLVQSNTWSVMNSPSPCSPVVICLYSAWMPDNTFSSFRNLASGWGTVVGNVYVF